MPRKKKAPLPEAVVTIERLDQEGRGVAHLEDGKVIFVPGALPGEKARVQPVRLRKRYGEADLLELLSRSDDRVEPKCPSAELCGGCSLQHLDEAKQIEAKQEVLVGDFRHIGKVEIDHLYPPMQGPHWRYRRRARLAAKYVAKKQKLMVGFRERRTPYVLEMNSCEVLLEKPGADLTVLADVIGALSIAERVPQVEVSISDDRYALVFRVLEEPTDDDKAKLKVFGEEHGYDIYLQPGGLDTIAALTPETVGPLEYSLPAYDLNMRFEPWDFIQVNADLNQTMIARALDLLNLKGEERVLDLFCGLGNFTLPIARHAKEVVGVEGDKGLVARARANAERNGLENAQFYTADLFKDVSDEVWMKQHYDKALFDPARAGAKEIIPLIVKLGIKEIVYVSCNPATLARDAGILVNEHGYKLEGAGVMDMFPHTAHVESIAHFTKD